MISYNGISWCAKWLLVLIIIAFIVVGVHAEFRVRAAIVYNTEIVTELIRIQNKLLSLICKNVARDEQSAASCEV